MAGEKIATAEAELFEKLEWQGLNINIQKNYHQRAIITALNQNIPEIFEAFTTHNILKLRADFSKHISECVVDCVDGSLAQIQLTDATKTAKFGWFVAETLLKVALNMATQAAGGIIIDGLHDALDTHGASPFESNKQNVKVKTSDGQTINVIARREAGYGQALKEINPEIFGRQLASDFTELALSKGYDVVEQGVTEKIVGWVQVSRNGCRVTAGNYATLLERVLMPLEILNLRLDLVQRLLNAVVADEIEEYFKNNSTSLNSLPSQERVQQVVERCRARIHLLGIHGYLTHLANLSGTYIPKLSKAWFLKSVIAETLTQNRTSVLNNNQNLSTNLWKFLVTKKLVAVRKNIPDRAVDSVFSDFNHTRTFNEEMSSTYESAKKKDKTKIYYEQAIATSRLSVTNREKFGECSTLATFLACEYFLDHKASEQKKIIRDTQNDSSYRNYCLFLPEYEKVQNEVSRLTKNYNLNLSVVISRDLLPK